MTNKNKGFTLAEMIISVAILSVVSLYILQMFIATKNLSIKSYEIDKSLRISKNIIELIASGESVSGNSKYELISNMDKQGDVYTLALDKHFDIAKDSSQLYTLSMRLQQKDGLSYIDIQCIRLKPYILDDERDIQISSISSIKKMN